MMYFYGFYGIERVLETDIQYAKSLESYQWNLDPLPFPGQPPGADTSQEPVNV